MNITETSEQKRERDRRAEGSSTGSDRYTAFAFPPQCWEDVEWPLLVAVAFVGVMMGRAEILGLLAPFGLAYMAACLAWNRAYAACALVGIILGRVWLHGFEAAALEAGMLAVLWLSAELVPKRRGSVPSAIRLTCAAVGACVAVRGIAAVQAGGSLHDLFLLLFEVLLVIPSALVFIAGLPLFVRWGARWDEDDTSAIVSAAIVGGVLLLGMQGIKPAGLHLGWVAAMLILFLFASTGLREGLGAGAAVGVTFGMAVEFDPLVSALFISAGAAAGLLCRFGQRSAVVCLSAVIILISVVPGLAVFPGPWELFLAVGLYLLWPGKRPSGVAAEVAATADYAGDSSSVGGEGMVRAALTRLRMALELPGRRTNEAGRLMTFARIFRRVATSFGERGGDSGEFALRSDRTAELVEDIGRSVCSECDSYPQCWQEHFLDTYRLLSEVLACMEMAGERVLDRRTRQLRRRCGSRASDVLEAARQAWRIERLGVKWASQFSETRNLAAAQLRGLADILEDYAVSGDVEVSRGEDSPRSLSYSAGVAQVARGGRGSSGDSHLIRRLGGSELVVLLSDGMGSGENARRESGAALSLLEELLQLGVDRGLALRTVNSVLLLRSSDDTCATVDMMSLSLVGGEAEFTKIGAAPSFIMRSGDVTCVPAGSVPIGILNELTLESTRMHLEDGDVVVMVTDGVMDALDSLTETGKACWIRRFLRSEQFADAEELATSLVARTASLSSDVIPDDMSAIAIELRARD